MKKILLTLTAITTLGFGTLAQTYVDIDATGNNDGSSWTDAYTNARDAFINSSDGDSIWIAEGKYIRSGTNRNLTFGWSTNNLSVFGGFDGTETMLSQRDWRNNETIFSGDMGIANDSSDNAYTVFSGPIGSSGNTIGSALIDGIIIQDGNAGAGSGNETRSGGGTFIFTYLSNITFKNTIWRDNLAQFGALSIWGFGTLDVRIENCRFTNNRARAGAPFRFRSNGYNVNVEMFNTLIDNNEVIDYAGNNGVFGHGGDIIAYNGGTISSVFYNCTWAKNLDNSSNTNKSLFPVFQTGGGNVLVDFKNCIFNENQHPENLFTTPSSYSISGTTVSVEKCIFSDTTGARINFSPTFKVGSVEFKDLANNDFHLSSNSIGIDYGVAIAAAYNPPAKDLAGNNRINGSNMDAGCYEFCSTTGVAVVSSPSPYTWIDGNIYTNDNSSATHTISSNSGCDSVITLNLTITITITGISNGIDKSISIYPNPTSGLVNVASTEKINAIRVLDFTGRVIITSTQNKIDMSDFENGVYFIEINTNKGIAINKVVKQS